MTERKMHAQLYGGTGEYIATVEVPPFETGFPPAVVWGWRFFLRQGAALSGRYQETFCYAASVEVERRAEAQP